MPTISTIGGMSAIGRGARGKLAFVLNETINADTANYNIANRATALGWNGIDPIDATITVAAGKYIYSSSPSYPAFDTGSGIPANSSLSLIINATASVLGAGGKGGIGAAFGIFGGGGAGTAGEDGGTAIKAQYPLSVTNNGTVAGGGGAGGGGGYAYNNYYFQNYASSGGAGGGGGRGYSPGLGGSSNSASGPDAGPSNAGSAATTSAAGTKGTGITRYNNSGSDPAGGATGGDGGNGGDLGMQGSPGQSGSGQYSGSGYPGGSPGKYAEGNSNITWVVSGTRIGAVS